MQEQYPLPQWGVQLTINYIDIAVYVEQDYSGKIINNLAIA